MFGRWEGERGRLPLGPAAFGFDEDLKFTGSGVYGNTQAKGQTYEVHKKTIPLRDKAYLLDMLREMKMKAEPCFPAIGFRHTV